MVKIADQLRLQELKLYVKYIRKNLPAHLLDWEYISNVNVMDRNGKAGMFHEYFFNNK